MCGRYGYIQSDFKTYGVAGVPSGFQAIYNGAPSQPLPVIVEDDFRHAELFRFGLIPFWSKTLKPKFSTINARAETILTSPAYRKPIRSQRCLVPCDFYFEWSNKNPFLFRMKDKKPFAPGGVWDVVKGAEDKSYFSFAIMTTEPNELTRQYHDRMPLILSPNSYDSWLSVKTDMAEILDLMKPYPSIEKMEVYPVSKLVNSPSNNYSDIIKMIE